MRKLIYITVSSSSMYSEYYMDKKEHLSSNVC